jgi:hypothetical protein
MAEKLAAVIADPLRLVHQLPEILRRLRRYNNQ